MSIAPRAAAIMAEAPLLPILRRHIAETGPLTVAAYMALALGHPKHGYYATRDPFGARGDFTTAPEISQLFGEALAVWCALNWEAMGRPAPVNLVELGPGRGTLMADVTRTLARIAPDLAATARVHLVETSPTLRAKQRAALAERNVDWHETFSSVPTGPMILLANEFFDALPVRQFVRADGAWRERLVDWDEKTRRLMFRAGPPLAGALPSALAAVPDGAVYEASAATTALGEEIGLRLAAAPGAALVIDYGRARTAAGDSLAAIQDGRKDADPLAAPGDADLTAHVDFEALAGALAKTGARSFGPVTQGTLLKALGIEARLAALSARLDATHAQALAAGARRLIAPDGMGTIFLALAALSPGISTPPGFA